MLISNSFAQQEKGIIGYDNWLNTWTDFKPNKKDYNQPTQILSGNISQNTKLTKSNIYLLLGDVFVTNNSTLTIEPGTIIFGDFKTKGSLTISRGCKIIAEGTKTDPIVFTSNKSDKKPGDWGGLFILGGAPTNLFGNKAAIDYGLRPSSFESISYGGDNADDSSGILKFVRIEYAGKKTREYGNFNGLTIAGIGLNTVLDNIMVSYCQGNSFNILGGDLVMTKMVSYRSNENDYEFNHGTQCNIVNSLAIRSPYVSSADGSRCLYVSSFDNLENVNSIKKSTYVNAENLTLVNVSDDLESDVKVGLVQEAIYIGEDAAFSIDKSVISGFNPAVILDDKIKINGPNLEKITFTRTYFNNCEGNIFREGYTNNDDLESWYGSRAFDNLYSKGPDYETFIESDNKSYPDFRLRVNKIIASNDLFDDDDDD
ncbi:hypothetical protein WPG_3088 [Winogradskyella sp. PG-2]|nr:hypothetical protein WPG_3088 [Winogradskyella sp. PG-2]